MRSPEPASLYRHGGGALLRAAVVPLTRAPDWWPDLGDTESCRSWIRHAWDVPGFADAVRHASPALGDRVDAIHAGRAVEDKLVRRAAAAMVRYLLRAIGRPTPFGLFAGVAPVSVGAAAHARWSDGHRAVARVDTQWLADVIDHLEAIPDLLERLDVVGNDLAVRRGGRWEVPLGPDRASVRYTRAVAEVRAAAASAVRFSVLADKVAAEFPGADEASVREMLTGLVRQGFLITCLRAPLTVVDPLSYLMERLGTLDAGTIPAAAALVRDLEVVHQQLRQHNNAAPSEGQAHIRTLLTQPMRRLSAAGRTPLAVDLRLDCRVGIPDHVVAEMERAASLLLRMTRRSAGEPVWRSFHAAFCDRYGTGTLVPVAEVVDPDAGLGYPAGYPGSVHHRPPAAVLERDEALLSLAWQAVADGSREITLSEDAIQAITAEEFDPRYIPPHVELAARIHASSVEALNRGDYILTVAPARSAGTLTSRFTPTATGTGLEEVYRAVPPAVDGAVPVQMSFPPVYPHAENVCRVPAYLPHMLTLGEHRSDGDGVITVEDLAVTATRERLYLVSMSRRRVVEPQVFHALSLEKQPPRLGRFLAHLPRAFSATWHEFDWGPHAHRLPYLPRIRCDRVVLSPARWRLTSRDLPPAATGHDAWQQAIDEWRRRWHCPDTIELRAADRTLRMSLDQPAHLAILRIQVERTGEAALTEAAATADDFGWIGGHAHEIAVPLVRTGPAAPSPLAGALPTITNAGHGHLPASGRARWLSAKVFTHPERLDDLIADHLPALLASLDGDPAYWFVRYRTPQETDHLRLRIRTSDRQAYAACAAAVGDWAQNLRDEGVISRLALDTYHPEVGRYGAGPAIEAAEAAFAADSHAVGTALRLLPGTTIHPTALTSIGMLDIAEGFLGSRDDAVAWLIDRPAAAISAERSVAEQVVRCAIDGLLPNRAEWPPAVADARRARAAALSAYRQTLPTDIDTEVVLESLLHMHHNRALGIDPDREATCRRLARQAALAHRVQQAGGDR